MREEELLSGTCEVGCATTLFSSLSFCFSRERLRVVKVTRFITEPEALRLLRLVV